MTFKTEEVTKREIIKVIIIIMALFFVLIMTFILLDRFLQYLEYENYKNEGYQSKFSFSKGCELKLKNINGFTTWEYCSNVGDDFVVKNYAVRRHKG